MNTPSISKEIFEDLIGQPICVSLLSAALEKGYFATAYLFCGPEGVGRRLAALRFLEGFIGSGKPSKITRNKLKSLNHPDLLWVEPTYSHQGELVPQSLASLEAINRRTPPQIRLEQIRDVKRFLGRRPLESKRSLIVIEDVERMQEAAANALLKTLEEPENGLIILISGKPQSLLSTIKSRCQKIPFSCLNSDDFRRVVLNFFKANDQAIVLNNELNNPELITLANGSPGQFINNLEISQAIPAELWPRLKELPQDPMGALSLARDITEALDGEQQIWVISWLQQHLWRKNADATLITNLEALRLNLLSYVQPRLAWEVALLKLKN